MAAYLSWRSYRQFGASPLGTYLRALRPLRGLTPPHPPQVPRLLGSGLLYLGVLLGAWLALVAVISQGYPASSLLGLARYGVNIFSGCGGWYHPLPCILERQPPN